MAHSSNDIRETFFQECEDLLEALSDGLRQLDDDVDDIEIVHSVFRAVHSIKGGAGAFGLDALVDFAHCFETVLDEVREYRIARDNDVMNLFHRAGDHLSDLVSAARDDRPLTHGEGARLEAELKALMGDAAGTSEPEGDAAAAEIGFMPTGLDITPIDTAPAAPFRYTIRFAPEAALYNCGNDPALLFRALGRLGKLTTEVDTSMVPALDVLEWQASYLSWTLTLETEEPESLIHNVFEFVEGTCRLEITPADAPDGLFFSSRNPPELDAIPDARTEDSGTAKPQTPNPPATSDGFEPGSADADAIRGSAPVEAASSTEAGDRQTSGASANASTTIRVNLDRVDRLINLVGELVIKEAMLSQSISQAGLSAEGDVGIGLDGLKQLAGEIQEGVMAIRAQPVKSMFQRMFRIMRETANATGKKVRLVPQGEHAEVDKTVIECLVDPLTHMIRNAIDHGLELPDERKAAGKSEEGTLILSASHRSGRVLIEVSDDGKGIDRARVRNVAERKGLIAPDADLTSAEIDNLLFAPGFSSKENVSNLSGRGVGLDVVKSAIQALGGRVSITSEAGEGTTFSISLPLTLAVLEGMVTEVAGQTVVVPITAVQEMLQPGKVSLHAVGQTGRVVESRGELVPIIDLGLAFGYRPALEDFEGHVLLLVETDADKRYAFVVDHIHDQRQVVIKSLEDNYGPVSGIAAATILGDGRIALIIDPDEIASSGIIGDARNPEIFLAAAE
ncbi:MAG: chemotaxis protein CheA [Roseovarius sp.]|nr:chemotaxis protein CheA [Roseovarius sp.]